MESPLLAPLWSLLRSDRLQAAVTELGAYTIKGDGPPHPVTVVNVGACPLYAGAGMTWLRTATASQGAQS